MKQYLFIVLLFFAVHASAQMSDSQVIDYVKSENAKGRNQNEIGTALLQRGVTRSQLERIKSQVEQENSTFEYSSATPSKGLRIASKTDTLATFADSIPKSEKKIFGKNIFNKKDLTFAPDLNIPTPSNYKLSAGDQILIEVWGASQASINKTISPEGTIILDNIGPVFLSGTTVKDATNILKNKLGSVYPGVDQDNGASSMNVSLGNIRSIQVNVIGEVLVPGTYTLTSLSSVFNALYIAGGINDIGSLREINVIRNGNKIATVDVYAYLLEGNTKTNISLQEGDVIIVPPYRSLVDIQGLIKRPMYYEMKSDETLKTLIDYAGGFDAGAYQEELTLIRKTGGYDKIFTINKNQMSSFYVQNGDSVDIKGGLNLFDNKVTIEGQIFRPGEYEVGQDILTVKDLIAKAGGVKENAYLGRALLTREKEDLTFEVLPLNLGDILNDKSKDILLKKNDQLIISANVIEENLGPFVIQGLVNNPGEFPYADNTSIKDLIVRAGGLLSAASTARVDIARRIIDPSSTISSSILSEMYSFSIEDGLVVDGGQEFILQPYDQVFIRKSPGYHEQRNVNLSGEVLFPGLYTLENKSERISDVIKRSGGLTPQAYAKGAKILRPLSEEEIKTKKETLSRINNMLRTDSISNETIEDLKYSTLGIQLDLALKNPGSDYDVILKEGDQILIPEYDNTIKIIGAVMNPNIVVYKKGKTLNYYIDQAGGYAENAKKKNGFIVYMNGTTAKAKSGQIQPGATIIIPEKDKKAGMTLGEKVAIGSSITSMASVIALLINSLVK